MRRQGGIVFFFRSDVTFFFSPSLLTSSFDPPTFPPPTSPKPTKKQCSPPHRLYALYLLDSLVKNVGEPYGSLFAREARLPRALAPAWAVHPPSRPALRWRVVGRCRQATARPS